MPHRKSPSGVAKNFIMHSAQFDRLKKESINTVTTGDLLSELSKAFPEDPPTAACFPKGWIDLRGLVLYDSRGEGVLDNSLCISEEIAILENKERFVDEQ
jgi:hypothetical protein